MDDKSQQFYVDNIERIEPKYFYSVNRAKKELISMMQEAFII